MEKTIITETGELRLRYGLFETASDGVTQYGVEVAAEGGESARVAEAFTDRAEAERFLALIYEGEVTPVTLYDVVYDWISAK